MKLNNRRNITFAYSTSDQDHTHPKGIFGGNVGTTMDSPSENQKKLGTLNGVLLPTLQTILVVILFIRLPSITAQAGCVYTTIIILTCVTSTLITAISLSAIATNGTIEAGGPYYIISRSLGKGTGGALGLLYYLGTSMACAMSILGGMEAVLRSIGDGIESEIQAAKAPSEFDPFL
jgi:potassium/chloride transporter 4/5/6